MEEWVRHRTCSETLGFVVTHSLGFRFDSLLSYDQVRTEEWRKVEENGKTQNSGVSSHRTWKGSSALLRTQSVIQFPSFLTQSITQWGSSVKTNHPVTSLFTQLNSIQPGYTLWIPSILSFSLFLCLTNRLLRAYVYHQNGYPISNENIERRNGEGRGL